jgi:proteasome accessory factor B
VSGVAGTKRTRKKGPRSGDRRPVEKLQRWLDLLAALLARRFRATFEELAREVPAYREALEGGDTADSVKRTFERDKDELRASGVAIETLNDDDGAAVYYQLRHREFYLPYLALTTAHQPPPRRARRDGHDRLPEVAFEPDELAAIASAAARAQQLGDPSLAQTAASARRKLSMDLDIGVPDEEVVELVPPLPSRGGHDEAVFEAVSDAVTRRKELSFRYRSMERDETTPHRVQPWGLFYLGSAWYLVAHDLDRAALRNFRLSRMSQARVSKARQHSADFEVPEDFDLRQHAQSAESWELGDADAVEVVVRFSGASGYVEAAQRLGVAVDGAPDERRFRVRRPEVFARWLLTFAGDAVPVSPPEFVEQFRGLVRETLALYEGDRE